MKNIKHEAQIWLQFLLPFAIWISILYITNTTFSINVESLKKLPEAITGYVVFNFIFTKWLWRLPFLQGWLVPFPDLEGTWKGNLQTTWKDPKTHSVPQSIPLILVIKQSFDSVSCVMFTNESTSYSTVASFTEDDDSGIKKLNYNYSNRPKVIIRDKSIIHDGAAILTIISKPRKMLKGEYWTNRKTTGDMSVKFASRELVQEFSK